jgi:hypothetical protein
VKSESRRKAGGRREPIGTASLIVAVVALILGLAGGAYAAKHYVITSTSQIKPSVLKKLKGASGPQGAPGAAGANGKDGTNGDPGSNGKDGTSATTSTFTGAKGECKAGGVEVHSASPDALVCNGETGFTETLPSKQTATGVWTVGNVAEIAPYPGNGNGVRIPLSFAIPLAAELEASQVHYIKANGKEIKPPFEEVEPEQCPGTVTEPKANAGNLCIYTFELENGLAYYKSMKNPATGEEGAAMTGVDFEVFATGNGLKGMGTWAVTAP